MGSQKYTYIGAYFVLDAIKEKGTEKIKECENGHTYDISISHEYCPTCGSRIFESSIEKEYNASISDIIGEDDVFTEEPFDTEEFGEKLLVFSNGIYYNSYKEDSFITELGFGSDMVQVERFKNDYRPYIQMIEAKTGQKVDVRYGIINYWM